MDRRGPGGRFEARENPSVLVDEFVPKATRREDHILEKLEKDHKRLEAAIDSHIKVSFVMECNCNMLVLTFVSNLDLNKKQLSPLPHEETAQLPTEVGLRPYLIDWTAKYIDED